MSTISPHPETTKSLIKTTVKSFHEYFSSLPPLSLGFNYALPHAYITVPLPPAMGGLATETFEQMYERVSPLLAAQYESGVKDFAHRLAEPSAEVWVQGDIAAVWVGWEASVDGRGIVRTVHVCGLHRVSGDGEGNEKGNRNQWRISGLVDMIHLAPEMSLPVVETGPVAEIMEPFEKLLAHIKAWGWEAIPALLLPPGGATISQGTGDPVTFAWSEYIKKLQVESGSGPVTEKKLFDCEARRCSDLAFVWAPFMLVVEGREVGKGVSVCSFRLEEGRWLICGLQETSSML